MHGNGTLTYPDGRVYEGGFKHGRHSGHGTLKDNGKIIKGKFLEGRLVLVWAGDSLPLAVDCTDSAHAKEYLHTPGILNSRLDKSWCSCAGDPPVLKEIDEFSAESVTLPETPPACRP